MRRTFIHALLTLALPATFGCAAFGGAASVHRAPGEIGLASYYGDEYVGRATASGTPYNRRHLTAAHRTLPFGTRVRVVNLENGKSAVVTITDRGPWKRGRVIDVSRRAARVLGFERQGQARVRLDVLG